MKKRLKGPVPGQVHLRVDAETWRVLQQYAEANNITISSVARQALRRFFSTSHDPINEGWREGFMAGFREVQAVSFAAMKDLQARHEARGGLPQDPHSPLAGSPFDPNISD